MVAVNLEPSVSISPSFGRAPGKSMTHSLIPIIADFSMPPLRRLEIRAYAASPYPLRNPNPPTCNSGETSGMTPALAENSVLDPDLPPAPAQSIIGTPLIPAEVLAEPGQASDLLMATPNSNVPLDIHALGTTLGMDMAMYCDTQGLIHLHQQDQWLATVMFFQSVIRRLDTMADARVATILPAMAPGTIRNFNYHPDVRAMIKTLSKTLTPLVIVKAELDARDTTWKQVFLPPGYSAHQPEAITSVKAFIRELLKYEKSMMAKLLLVGLKARGRGSTHDPVPRLDVMIVGLLRTMSPEHELQPPDELRSAITSTQRIRFGYLRVQMVIQRQTPEENGVHSIWEVIDRHLESLRRKSADWKVAFARLVLSLDAQLFDGINTARDVRAFEVRMPSDKEVATELFARAQAPEVNDETPTTHVQEEIF
ncbi:hypothetical protein KEM48_006514 [Puccinia striiformis f. sp. tritici PST-130]|nr:hypothetical protein KEM48_006514 [Puccinia striiformis f. sp. tritici PST-130]